MKDPVSRRSRGFGFITFTDVAAVENALAHEPHTIDARKVRAICPLFMQPFYHNAYHLNFLIITLVHLISHLNCLAVTFFHPDLICIISFYRFQLYP